MSGYDPNKDKCVTDFGQIEGTDLNVTLRSYNGGEEKLSVTRDGGGSRVKQILREKPDDLVPFAYWLISTYDPDGSRKPQPVNRAVPTTAKGSTTPPASRKSPKAPQGRAKASSNTSGDNVVPLKPKANKT